MSFSSHFFDQAGTGLTPFASGNPTPDHLNVFDFSFSDAAAGSRSTPPGDRFGLSTELNYQPDANVSHKPERSLSSASSQTLQTAPVAPSATTRVGKTPAKPKIAKRARSNRSASSSSPAVGPSDLDSGSPGEDLQPGTGNGSGRRAKFLERNRIAASKCRSKKKEWTNNLEAAARQASQQSRELHQIVARLRDELLVYKTELMQQQQRGCGCGEVEQFMQASGSESLQQQQQHRHNQQQDEAMYFAEAQQQQQHQQMQQMQHEQMQHEQRMQQQQMDQMHGGDGYPSYESTYLDGQ